MSELLGGVFMLGIFFVLGAFCQYFEWRKAEKKRKEDELLNLQAMYVLAAQEHAVRQAALRMEAERKNRTFTMRNWDEEDLSGCHG